MQQLTTESRANLRPFEPSPADSSSAGLSSRLRCLSPASPSWWIGAVAAAVLVSGLAQLSPRLAVVVGVVMFGGAVSWFDLTQRRVPDPLSLGTAFTAVGVGAVSGRLAPALAVGVLVGAALLLVHLVDPEGLGFGDVKFVPAFAALAASVLSTSVVVAAVVVASLAAAAAVAVLRARNGVPFAAVCSLMVAIAVVGYSL